MDTVLIISSWPTGLYDYVQYMQMQSICIVIAYADVRHMDMFNICCIFSFFRSDPKKVNSDLNEIAWNLSNIHYPSSSTCYL
ncbi:hypothetical protein F3J31_13705 [Enterobacter sp. Acro-832]|nr:hypothetical protein [Enterobacter sp. Acro-832]